MATTISIAETKPSDGGRLCLSRLDLTNFRNYPELRLDIPGAGGALVVLNGENGAGKTNLLEAISYLGPGRGLRSAKLQDVTTRDVAGLWAVAGVISTGEGDVKIGCGIETAGEDAERARRIVVVDGEKAASPAALAPVMTVLWLTPKMDRLFQEGPSERRRFFDQLATGLFPEHAAQISAFEKAMRERIRLLTEGRRHLDEAWLAALERRMAEHAVAIAAIRLETLGLIRAHMPFTRETPFPLPEIGLEGEIEELVSNNPALEAEDHYIERLKKYRARDRDAGRTLRGPHKTDLVAIHPKKGMVAGECSTGEQKAMLIGIVLSAARLQVSIKGRAPVLLLDEVIAHLDEHRRKALFDELAALRVQTWMTGTDEKMFQPLQGRAAFFTVNDGAISRPKKTKNPKGKTK